jgi:hypothetical protein
MNDAALDFTQADMTQAVREAAMLASVSISVWEGQRTDATLMNEVKLKHGATGDVGKVIKNMMAGADALLKGVHSTYYAVRSKHYEMTLPWVSDPHAARQRGPRLLPHLLFNNYSMEMSNLRRMAIAKLEEFLVEYPALVLQAKTNLAGMADAVYPTAEEIKGLFRVHFDFEPIPQGANFRGLDDHMLERLGKALQNKQQARSTRPSRDVGQTKNVSGIWFSLGLTEGRTLTFRRRRSTTSGIADLLPGGTSPATRSSTVKWWPTLTTRCLDGVTSKSSART